MSLLIGMDEAGLGPNLGPFVVAATVWELPGSPGSFDFWTAFEQVLTRSPSSCDPRLHVADSKQVFQPGRGIGSLERGVWSALRLCEVSATTFQDLCSSLSGSLARSLGEERGSNTPRPTTRRSLFDDDELAAARVVETNHNDVPPWYGNGSLALPVESNDESLVEPWRRICERLQVRLVAIRAAVVEPGNFNAQVRRYDNKSAATSRIAMNLLSGLWHPDEEVESLIVADKHGGRNRYEPLLAEMFRDAKFETLEEGPERSVYRTGNSELRFQPRAEEHLPVALASMTAKYLRELAMHQFNHFWHGHLPDLKPTQGYPVDAKRFRSEIADTQRMLNIPDDVLWRER